MYLNSIVHRHPPAQRSRIQIICDIALLEKVDLWLIRRQIWWLPPSRSRLSAWDFQAFRARHVLIWTQSRSDSTLLRLITSRTSLSSWQMRNYLTSALWYDRSVARPQCKNTLKLRQLKIKIKSLMNRQTQCWLSTKAMIQVFRL